MLARKSLLFLYLVTCFFTLISAYTTDKLNLISDRNQFYITYFGFLLLPLLLVLYNTAVFKNLKLNEILLLLAFGIYTLILSITGYVVGNEPGTWLVDTITFFSFLIFIILGTSEMFFKEFLKIGLLFFIVGVVVNMKTTTLINSYYWLKQDNLFDFEGKDRIARSIVGYKTQFAMSFWPLFYLTMGKRSKKYIVLIIMAVVFIFLQQILFQKRAPTVRILCMVSALFFILYRFRNINMSVIKKLNRSFLVFIAVIGLGAVVFIDKIPVKLISNQFDSLQKRFQGKTGIVGVRYKEPGLKGIFSTDNERLRETFIMIDALSPLEVVFGRKFGGRYEDREILKTSRDSTHIGIMNFLFKGGIIYFMIYVLILTSVISKYNLIKHDQFHFTLFIIFLIFTFFLFIEGWYYYKALVFDLMLYGLIIGKLLSYKPKKLMYA